MNEHFHVQSLQSRQQVSMKVIPQASWREPSCSGHSTRAHTSVERVSYRKQMLRRTERDITHEQTHARIRGRAIVALHHRRFKDITFEKTVDGGLLQGRRKSSAAHSVSPVGTAMATAELGVLAVATWTLRRR